MEKQTSLQAQLGDLAANNPELGINPKMVRAGAAVAADQHFELNVFGVAQPRSGEKILEWCERLRESGEMPWLFNEVMPGRGTTKLSLSELRKLSPAEKLARANGER